MEIGTCDEFHRDEVVLVHQSKIKNADNIGMVEFSHRQRFLLESFRESRIPGKLRSQNFQCNRTLQTFLNALVNRTHPALADQFFDIIRFEQLIQGFRLRGSPLPGGHLPGARHFPDDIANL